MFQKTAQNYGGLRTWRRKNGNKSTQKIHSDL